MPVGNHLHNPVHSLRMKEHTQALNHNVVMLVDNNSFASSCAFMAHEITHLGVKHFTCDACGNSFAYPGGHKLHKTMHTCVKHFICDTSARKNSHRC